MDPLRPHSHVNNSIVPDANTTIKLQLTTQDLIEITLKDLQSQYPRSVIESYSYQTDHGKHGPYRLEGVSLLDVLKEHISEAVEWTEVELLSADGFGNRIYKNELFESQDVILLCFKSNDEVLKREQGLVRLVVPFETDNALRQVKWVRTIRVK